LLLISLVCYYMRYRVIYFQCLCYLVLPLYIVGLCISFSFVFFHSVFLKLQFMRIKMYIMSNCCVRAGTWRCRARDDSACKHCVLHGRLSITTLVAYRTLAGSKMHGDWQLCAIIVSTLSPFVRPRPRHCIYTHARLL